MPSNTPPSLGAHQAEAPYGWAFYGPGVRPTHIACTRTTICRTLRIASRIFLYNFVASTFVRMSARLFSDRTCVIEAIPASGAKRVG